MIFLFTFVALNQETKFWAKLRKAILRLLKTHYLGLICPGTTFFAGSLPGWWDFTAELKQHNFNPKVGLHALALVWKGGQLWECLSGESIPSKCFLCVLTKYNIVHKSRNFKQVFKLKSKICNSSEKSRETAMCQMTRLKMLLSAWPRVWLQLELICCTMLLLTHL